MRAVIDPVDDSAMCGTCRHLYRVVEDAEECCEPYAYGNRAVLAGAFILLSLIVTFVVIPLL